MTGKVARPGMKSNPGKERESITFASHKREQRKNLVIACRIVASLCSSLRLI
jgi:hypothetical protein